MNKKYFRYLMKSNKNIIVVMTLVYFLIFPFMVFVYDQTRSWSTFPEACVWCTVIVMLQSFFIPLYMLMKKLNKRSVDMYYALPMRRETMFKTETLFGLSLMLVPWMICFVMAMISFWIKTGVGQAAPEILAVLAVTVIYGSTLYMINTVTAGKCNNIIDALITAAAYDMLPLIIYVVAGYFIDSNLVGFSAFRILNFANLSPHGALFVLTNWLSTRMLQEAQVFPMSCLAVIIHLLIGVFAYFEAKKDYVQSALENAEQRSTSFWSYRFLIPVNCCLFLFLATYDNGLEWVVVFTVIIFIGYLIANFVAERQIKITKKVLVLFAAVLLITNGITYVFKENRSFGINERFPDRYDEIVLEMFIYSPEHEYNVEIYVEETIVNDPEVVEQIQQLQRRCVNRYYEDANGSSVGSMSVDYRNNDNSLIEYSYSVWENDYEDLVDVLVKKGYSIKMITHEFTIEERN